MAAKAEVAVAIHSDAEIDGLCRAFGLATPLTHRQRLFGGYSGSNYRVVAADGAVAALKICHGYESADIEAQARLMAHIRACGVECACTALPAAQPTADATFTIAAPDGTPCCLLSWVDGKPADKVVAAASAPASASAPATESTPALAPASAPAPAPASAVTAETVLREVGRGLARIHGVPVAGQGFRTYSEGGACDVRKHMNGEYAAALAEAEALIAGHDFLPFYTTHAEELRKAMTAEGLPHGVLHGDPFLDNILVDPDTGMVRGFIDFEDVTVGPLLFDVACCASACCFRQKDNALDMQRLRALMEGYTSERPLCAPERGCFVNFMKLTMLCNCSWRFKQFNIDHREIEDCRDAHRELQERVLSLEDELTMSAIEGMLQRLPSA